MRRWLFALMLAVTACQWTDWITAPTPAPTAETACVWQWTTQPLPDVTAQLTDALSGIAGVTISASAFGENCLNADGSVRYFASMETDYALSVSAERMADALEILVAEAQQGRGGSNPARITLIVSGGTPNQVPFATAEKAVAQALRGDELLKALQGS